MANYTENRKAKFNYEILQDFEAGIELLGHEVKAVRSSLASLDSAHISIRGDEAYLLNCTISPYQPKNTPKEYDPVRNRKLLLNKKEINELKSAESKKGLTIVPLTMYNKGRKIKVKIAIVRGKKKFDKRETIKKREDERDIARTLKNEM
jgi:SsrA-binding protein